MSEPREIKPDEVRVGDTIRTYKDNHFEYGNTKCHRTMTIVGLVLDVATMSIKYEGFGWDSLEKDTVITLLSRPLPKHKYAVGQRVQRDMSLCGCDGIIEACRDHNFEGEPIYLLPKCLHHPPQHWRESELTPIPEEVWEPKILDYVTYEGEKHVVTAIEGCFKGLCLIIGLDSKCHNAKTSELSPWKEAQP